jgi:F-type H+-transporting ATPase subunit epsilon
MRTIHVDVVSAEESIFSGEATFVALPGEAGELGIYPRHTPLITRIRPGSVRIHTADGGEEFVFVAGGILEVQPDCVTVMSDTAVRGSDMDEEKANAAKQAQRKQSKTPRAISIWPAPVLNSRFWPLNCLHCVATALRNNSLANLRTA